MKQEYEDISDNEIVSMLGEEDENVNKVIHAKYDYLINVLINKHYRIIKFYDVDKEELLSEAAYGFSDGISNYKVGKNTSLKTFLAICVERRILKVIRKYSLKKSRIEKSVISFDSLNVMGKALKDYLTDGKDPLSDLTSIETYNEIVNLAKNNLSKLEYEVFIYMINYYSSKTIAKVLDKTPKQIGNTIQRIKAKMRKLYENPCK